MRRKGKFAFMGPGIAACRKEWLERHQQMGVSAGEALASFRWCLSHVTGIEMGKIPLQSQMLLTTDQQSRMEEIMKRLEKNEPFQYILNEAWFFGRRFEVNPSVLIPRPETEELVHWILKDHPEDSVLRLFDIGTGSGCIPITLKLEKPNWQVSSCDLSSEALRTAKANAAALGAEVEFVLTDILTTRPEPRRFDIICSNPPYIPYADAGEMESNVKDFEPEMALFVPGEDALLFYRAIAGYALVALEPGGKIYFETHFLQAENVAELCRAMGFTAITRKDVFGNNRMVKAVKAMG